MTLLIFLKERVRDLARQVGRSLFPGYLHLPVISFERLRRMQDKK